MLVSESQEDQHMRPSKSSDFEVTMCNIRRMFMKQFRAVKDIKPHVTKMEDKIRSNAST